MRNLYGIVFLLALLLLAACGEENLPEQEPLPTSDVSTPSEATPLQTDQLDDTWWRLHAMGDRSGDLVELVTLGITGDVIQGTGGCNTYELTFSTISNRGLALTDPVKSATSCPQPHGVMTVEEEFFTRLGRVAAYDLADNHLTLFDAGGEPLLEFMVDARVVLNQSSWAVASLNGVPFTEADATSIWFHDFEVQVATPCHMAFLTWESNEVSTMSFTDLNIADAFCPEEAPLPDERKALLDGLLEVTTLRKVNQEQMELTNADRSMIILLEDISWHHPAGTLLGTRWVLMSLHGESLPPDHLTMMMVGHNGVYGMAGCIEGFPGAQLLAEGTVRTYSRPYFMDDRCGPNGPDELSQAVIDAAAGSKRHVHLPGRLEMLDDEGEPVLVFRQVPTETELSETQWIPVTISGEPVIGDTGISLSFPGVWMSFHDGCNAGGGEYMVPVPGRIYMAGGEITEQDCPEMVPGERDQRDRYRSIYRASRYQLTATTLEFFDDQGNTLAGFEAKVVRYGVEDTRWNLTTMNGAPIHEDANITLQFTGWGAGGWSSCNEYTLESVHVDRNTIETSGIVTTEEGCPDMPEQEYFETLMTVERYQLDRNRLTLLNATGQPVLEYRLDRDITALTDTGWTAVTYLGAPLEEPGSIHISFANNTFEIRAGCYLIQLYGLGIDGSRLTMTGGYHSSAEGCDYTPEGQPDGVPPTISESVSSIAGYRFLDTNQLELVNNAGETLFVLEPASQR